jgi:hypothetical protein
MKLQPQTPTVCRLFDFDHLKACAEPIQYQFGRECKSWCVLPCLPLPACRSPPLRRLQVRSMLLSEAGESETPSTSDPQSNEGANDAAAETHAAKRVRGSDLSSDDQEGFAEACSRVAPLFTGSIFPRIPRSSIEGISESAVSAACAHLVSTKAIDFPYHRQFTSDAEVKAMVDRRAITPCAELHIVA